MGFSALAALFRCHVPAYSFPASSQDKKENLDLQADVHEPKSLDCSVKIRHLHRLIGVRNHGGDIAESWFATIVHCEMSNKCNSSSQAENALKKLRYQYTPNTAASHTLGNRHFPEITTSRSRFLSGKPKEPVEIHLASLFDDFCALYKHLDIFT